MEKYSYRPNGVCSTLMEFTLDNGKVMDLKVTGGCNGNLKGIASLIKGMDIKEVIEKLEGIECGFKHTSCPDQIAKGLKKYEDNISK